MRQARAAAGANLAQRGWGRPDTGWSPDEVTTNSNRVLDRACVLQAVPIAAAADLIAAFPNGFFTDDWSPMANMVLAGRLAAHGAALWGIGANALAFRVADDADRTAILAIVETD